MGKYIGKKLIWAIVCILGVIIIVFTIMYFAREDPTQIELAKPVIYLYPETKTEIEVKLDLDGQLSFTYPKYDNGWRVTAYPDGTLVDGSDGREYSYLFWESDGNPAFDMSCGFVVAGGDTVEFLREKLAFMGLLPKEYNEFIVYWAPMMEANAYNLIAFQGESYTDTARLEVVPAPDSMLRVFMAYKPLDNPVALPEQKLETFERSGFAVIEWGGAVIR